ncbi:MAG: S8 family serine peptidase, partial [Candidatus Thorarchaeota archaeon]
MYRRYLILLILLAPAFFVPKTVATQMILSPSEGTIPLIEPRLRMEVQSSGSHGASALLEFTDELSGDDIRQVESLGIEFTRRGSSIVNVGKIYSARVTDTSTLIKLRNLGLLRATSGTKQYIPSITSSVPAINADEVWTNLERDGNAVDGTGVTVAVIDTGVTWTHPAFWRQSPGIYHTIEDSGEYYIDLDSDMIADSNEGPIESIGGFSGPSFSYASDYMYIDVDGISGFSYVSGDRWIGGIDANDDSIITLGVEDAVMLDVSKVAILYDQEAGNVYIRDVNLTLGVSVIDHDGHGTHVASTIAGGQVGFTSYVGVAPGADLMVIKSPLRSSDILDAIDFAIENEADIINMSFSSYLGFLDGTDLEDIAVTEAFLRYGVVSVTAAGNMGGTDKHARFLASSGDNGSVTLAVDNPPDYSYLNLLWHSSDRDEQVILTDPDGGQIDLGEFSTIAYSSWALNEEHLSAYVFADINMRGINNIIIQISTQEHFWTNGAWTVTVRNAAGDSVWIDAFAWDGRWGTSHMTFSDNLDPGRTISSPGTADFAVAVTAYDESSSNIYYSSSRGPRVDGTPKPTVIAPGVSIQAAKRTLTYPLYEPRTGTSMASPHVAGVLALIHQASGVDSAWLDYSALVNGAGGQSSHYETASPTWGHGLVDALWSVRHVLQSPAIDDSPYASWTGIDYLISDSEDITIAGELDITGVQAFIDNDTLGLAIQSRESPDYQGTNVLTIGWDSDSNPGTGVNGANFVVNITGDIAEVFEWNGGSYDPSSMTCSWWINSSAVILRINGVTLGTRGDVSVSTHNSTMADVDQTVPGTLVDMLFPLMSELSLELDDGSILAHVTAQERDTPLEQLSVNWDIVDGPLNILNSSFRTGEDEFTITIPENL